MIDLYPCVSQDTATRMHYDRDRGLPDLLHQHALTTPQATAIAFGDRSLGYAELDRISDQLAGYLAFCGVVAGDTVCLLLPRALDTIVAMLAILKAGGAYVPLDPSHPSDHLQYVLAECAPRIVLSDVNSREKMRPVVGVQGAQLLDIGEALKAARVLNAPRPTVSITGADVAYVMYTSGSSGRPKGVAIPHRGVARLVLDQNYIEFSGTDVVLHNASISFDASTFEIWGALLNGCKLIGMPEERCSIDRLCGVIRENGVTTMLLTTGLFNLFADHASRPMPSLKHVLFGGEVASTEHAVRFARAHRDCLLTNVYGPTETSVFATTYSISPDFSGSEIPIGAAIERTCVHVVDDDLREVPPGVEGQLVVSGDGLAIGYHNRPDLTEERFVSLATHDGMKRCYLTGDLAVIQSDGTVLFKGRSDRQIKIDGKRIELDEIEAALRRHSCVSDSVVVYAAKGTMRKRLIAYLKPRSEASRDPDFVPKVMATLRSTLPAYMIPSTVVVLDEFPLNVSGKVDRVKLSLPVEPLPVRSATSASASKTEVMLLSLWQDVLGTADIHVDRTFFDLGGTSLQLMRIHAGIEAQMARSVDIVALFSHTTIGELARFLDGKPLDVSRFMSPAERAALQRRTRSQLHRSPA